MEQTEAEGAIKDFSRGVEMGWGWGPGDRQRKPEKCVSETQADGREDSR